MMESSIFVFQAGSSRPDGKLDARIAGQPLPAGAVPILVVDPTGRAVWSAPGFADASPDAIADVVARTLPRACVSLSDDAEPGARTVQCNGRRVQAVRKRRGWAVGIEGESASWRRVGSYTDARVDLANVFAWLIVEQVAA